MKEDTLALVEACFDEQFDKGWDAGWDKGWDAGVRAAFEIVELEVGGLGHTRVMARIRKRFLEELEMKED